MNEAVHAKTQRKWSSTSFSGLKARMERGHFCDSIATSKFLIIDMKETLDNYEGTEPLNHYILGPRYMSGRIDS